MDRVWPQVGRSHLDFESEPTLKMEDPDSVPCHNHKGHQSSLVALRSQTKCGPDQPSSMELFVLATLTRREMDRLGPDKCYFNFPVCLLYSRALAAVFS